MKRLLAWLVVLALLGIACASGLMVLVAVKATSVREVRPSDCMIILGCRVRPDGTLSDSLRYRTEAALAAYREGLAPVIIASGGQGPDEPMTEALAIRDWLVERGVPSEKILLEDQSTDTWENLRLSYALMRENGWKTAIVVTNNYHVERSLWIARDLGIDVTGIPAREPVLRSTYLYNHFREAGSWVLYYWNKWF